MKNVPLSEFRNSSIVRGSLPSLNRMRRVFWCPWFYLALSLLLDASSEPFKFSLGPPSFPPFDPGWAFRSSGIAREDGVHRFHSFLLTYQLTLLSLVSRAVSFTPFIFCAISHVCRCFLLSVRYFGWDRDFASVDPRLRPTFLSRDCRFSVNLRHESFWLKPSSARFSSFRPKTFFAPYDGLH